VSGVFLCASALQGVGLQKDKVINSLAANAAAARESDTDVNWLLLGKLAPPQQRVNAARRTALLAWLDANANVALSVIVSLPGFGKTTLLLQWWQSLQDRNDVAVRRRIISLRTRCGRCLRQGRA
jgi:hypothetical protein